MIRPALILVLALVFMSGAIAETRDERFKRIDGNGDGVISYEEHAAEDEAEFRKIDANGDGFIDLKEYAAWLGKRTPGAPSSVLLSVARCFFKTVDAKNDGKLSREKLRAYNDRVFKWLAGDDGRMTLEESKQVPPPEIIPRQVCN